MVIFPSLVNKLLIVRISTFEHIGFDENPRDPGKILAAIENTRNLLALAGRAIITLPLGYNSELDDLIREEKILFDEKYYMKRISRLNSWVEVKWDAVCAPAYDKPFRFANWLFIGLLTIFQQKNNLSKLFTPAF